MLLLLDFLGAGLTTMESTIHIENRKSVTDANIAAFADTDLRLEEIIDARGGVIGGYNQSIESPVGYSVGFFGRINLCLSTCPLVCVLWDLAVSIYSTVPKFTVFGE